MTDHDLLGLGKALQYFDGRIAELHREYAEQLLTHRNPYTKTEYRGEPALLIVELLNENSLVEADPEHHSLLKWGRAPLRIEPVTGRIVLPGRLSDVPLEMVPLDGAGASMGRHQPAARSDAGPTFRLDRPTGWYLIQGRGEKEARSAS